MIVIQRPNFSARMKLFLPYSQTFFPNTMENRDHDQLRFYTISIAVHSMYVCPLKVQREKRGRGGTLCRGVHLRAGGLWPKGDISYKLILKGHIVYITVGGLCHSQVNWLFGCAWWDQWTCWETCLLKMPFIEFVIFQKMFSQM